MAPDRVDENLWQRLQAKESQARERVVGSELLRLFNFFLALTQDFSVSAELSKKTFQQAIHEIKPRNEPKTLAVWLYGIAIEVFKQKVKSKDATTRPYQWSGVNSDHASIMKALSTLSPDERVLIVLKDVENRSYEDLTVLLKQSVGRLRDHLTKARWKLRNATLKVKGIRL